MHRFYVRRRGSGWSESTFFNGLLGDTWEYDGLVWTQVASTGPGARAYPVMAYDTHRLRTVLFGGSHQSQPTDTWEWDGAVWTRAATSGPAGRVGAALVYDSQLQQTIMFGGQSAGTNVGETWKWDPYHTATAVTYGAGCGSPSLALTPDANRPPKINSTARALLTNTPSLLSFVVLGWSQTTFGPFQLPLPLAGFGMPGCDLLQSSESGSLPTTSTGPGTAIYNLPLPNWSGLIGVRVYLQAWAYAPGANAGNTIVSNGIEWAIGNS